MKKLRKVLVKTPKGDRWFTMRPVTDELDDGEIYCDTVCPYGGEICTRLPDPRNPSNPEVRFTDFCNSLGDSDEEHGVEEDIELKKTVPLDGEIERVFPDFPDIIKIVNEENPLVRLGDVIDSVCEGGCEYYCPDHSKCNSSNSLCVLKELLKDKNFGKKPRKLQKDKEK